MGERVGSSWSEIIGLKAPPFAWSPVIASLRDNIAFLERNALFQTKLQVADNDQKPKNMEVVVGENSFQELREGQGCWMYNGLESVE